MSRAVASLAANKQISTNRVITLGKQVFDSFLAEVELIFEPDCLEDDAVRESVAPAGIY